VTGRGGVPAPPRPVSRRRGGARSGAGRKPATGEEVLDTSRGARSRRRPRSEVMARLPPSWRQAVAAGHGLQDSRVVLGGRRSAAAPHDLTIDRTGSLGAPERDARTRGAAAVRLELYSVDGALRQSRRCATRQRVFGDRRQGHGTGTEPASPVSVERRSRLVFDESEWAVVPTSGARG